MTFRIIILKGRHEYWKANQQERLTREWASEEIIRIDANLTEQLDSHQAFIQEMLARKKSSLNLIRQLVISCHELFYI